MSGAAGLAKLTAAKNEAYRVAAPRATARINPPARSTTEIFSALARASRQKDPSPSRIQTRTTIFDETAITVNAAKKCVNCPAR